MEIEVRMSRRGSNRLGAVRLHQKRCHGGALGTQPPGKCTLRHRPTVLFSQSGAAGRIREIR
jgi:hypothetical protein